MDSFIIETFKNKDFNAVIELLGISFKSKFETMVSLPYLQIVSLLKNSWNLNEDNPSNGHFVAKINDNVAGVILLKYSSQPRNSNNKVLFPRLIKNYGFRNTIKYLLGMSLLNHKLLEGECYIEHIAINPNYRGKGLGAKLIHHAKEFAKTIPHVSSYSLNVAGTNKKAYDLYKRLEFKEVEKYKISSFFMEWLVGEREWLYMAQPLIKDEKIPI